MIYRQPGKEGRDMSSQQHAWMAAEMCPQNKASHKLLVCVSEPSVQGTKPRCGIVPYSLIVSCLVQNWTAAQRTPRVGVVNPAEAFPEALYQVLCLHHCDLHRVR